MKLSPSIDLGKSLRQVFGDSPESKDQIEQDRARQVATTDALLKRFFTQRKESRRELTILADEVGLGKTYVALAVAVSILDAIRRGEVPEGLPSNKPVVLVLTPTNDALFNKWIREAEAFKKDCARKEQDLDWLEIRTPIPGESKSGNMVDLAAQMRDASRQRPMLLISKQSVFGATLNDREWWRRRALAIVFEACKVPPDGRKWWCKQVLGSRARSQVGELLDLRKSYGLWSDGEEVSKNLYRAFQRSINEPRMRSRIERAIGEWSAPHLLDAIDDLTRLALAGDLPVLPLVVIDEIHNLKNEQVQARRHLLAMLGGRVSRLLGLSATPFQLRQDELLSILKLRDMLDLPAARRVTLDNAVEALSGAMRSSREAGDVFRRRWLALRPQDKEMISDSWRIVAAAEKADGRAAVREVRPPRCAHALEAALDLDQRNLDLRTHLRPFVIRHHHARGYREHFIGRRAENRHGEGSPHFAWAPGLEVRGDDELAQYLMMRAVALAKDEKGLPPLGAELTGSYRHLVETSAVWKRLSKAKNPLLQEYQVVLDGMIGHRTDERDPDREHCKIEATARRSLEFFKRGQKTLIFCVFTKTAEAIRDRVQEVIDHYLFEIRHRVFGDGTTFENFRRRFFNRREPLFSLIQDQPLLGRTERGRCGVPDGLKLNPGSLRRVAEVLVKGSESAAGDKPDRRLLLAATEQVAITAWQESSEGREWIGEVLANCKELEERIGGDDWLVAREPLSRSERAGRQHRPHDPEARRGADDPLDAEYSEESVASRSERRSIDKEADAWVDRLRQDAIGQVVSPYFREGVVAKGSARLPLLAEHHADLMAKLDLETRAVAGQVFRRILMAEEFLLRYLADVERENATRWPDFLADRYVQPLEGHIETLRDRVQAYLETIVRAGTNRALLTGYHSAAENRNVVQLVKGGMERDRYFLGFNTPYRPEILVATSVGQEGIDLHRECRHVIHHDLCWNPATIEQRTGRVDRIGSKVERERLGANDGDHPSLEIVVPYLAATYDERMFEELYRRAQLFEVTLGGEMRVEGRIEPEHVKAEKRSRAEAGIGTEDEDLGAEGNDTGTVDLPEDMVARLRVDLSVWTSENA